MTHKIVLLAQLNKIINVSEAMNDDSIFIDQTYPLDSISDVIFSGIGTVVWIVAIISWVFAFQMNRAEWGEFADSISFIIPLGRA